MNVLHLPEDRLIEIAVDGASPSEVAHLTECTACEARRLEISDVLGEVDEVFARQADEAFPSDRLARQRARILHRVELDGRPARVISFPAAFAGAPSRRRRQTRWGPVAAAVAASFVVGLLADHLAHELPGTQQSRVATHIVSKVASTSASRSAQADDELLGQLELAGTGVVPAALRPLDAVTPRAWDVR